VQPDAAVFNCVLDAELEPQQKRRMWQLCLDRHIFPTIRAEDTVGAAELDLHVLSEGAAEVAVRWWLLEAIPGRVQQAGPDAPRPPVLQIITGHGKTRPGYRNSDLRHRVGCLLQEMEVPTIDGNNPGRLVIDAAAYYGRGGMVALA